MRGDMRVRKRFLLTLLFVSLSVCFFIGIASAMPYGAGSITEIGNTTAPMDTPEQWNAYAGNITELVITGYSTTQTWQGYVGNVSGVIQLADSQDHVIYNWTSASPRGEVYASTNDTIDWRYVQCFNFTATGDNQDDTGNAGGTSQFGTNYTQLESRFGIISDDDADAVSITFTSQNHQEFYTNNLNFSAGECHNVKLYNSGGVGTFDEVLLYEPQTSSVIFTSVINRDADGYDTLTHDFEMIVLDNGHGVDLSPTTYYFYLELG